MDRLGARILSGRAADRHSKGPMTPLPRPESPPRESRAAPKPWQKAACWKARSPRARRRQSRVSQSRSQGRGDPDSGTGNAWWRFGRRSPYGRSEGIWRSLPDPNAGQSHLCGISNWLTGGKKTAISDDWDWGICLNGEASMSLGVQAKGELEAGYKKGKLRAEAGAKLGPGVGAGVKVGGGLTGLDKAWGQLKNWWNN